MASKLIRTVLGQLGLTQIQHVSPVRFRAPALVRQVYRQVEDEFGVLAPPMALHAPAPPVLAATWVMLREAMLVPGQADRATKEAVATEVSLANTCPFCITVHSNTLTGLTGFASATAPGGPVTDPGVREAAAWAKDAMAEPGAQRHEPACPAAAAPELIGTAVILQYLNRMVNVFLGEVPLPPGVPKAALGRVMRTLGKMIQAAAVAPHPAGQSLDLLPPAARPADLSWADSNPVVADAFARACAVIDAAGAQAAPAEVREVVAAELAGWHGEQRGPSRAWVEEAVSGLAAAHQPAARLALLIALASYQVDRDVVTDFQRGNPDDAALIGLASWASLAAARRYASWVPVASLHTVEAS